MHDDGRRKNKSPLNEDTADLRVVPIHRDRIRDAERFPVLAHVVIRFGDVDPDHDGIVEMRLRVSATPRAESLDNRVPIR